MSALHPEWHTTPAFTAGLVGGVVIPAGAPPANCSCRRVIKRSAKSARVDLKVLAGKRIVRRLHRGAAA